MAGTGAEPATVSEVLASSEEGIAWSKLWRSRCWR